MPGLRICIGRWLGCMYLNYIYANSSATTASKVPNPRLPKIFKLLLSYCKDGTFGTGVVPAATGVAAATSAAAATATASTKATSTTSPSTAVQHTSSGSMNIVGMGLVGFVMAIGAVMI